MPQVIRKLGLGVLLILTGATASCVKHNSGGGQSAAGQSGQPTPTAAAVSTNVNKLGQLITLPYRPLSVVWQQEARGKGSTAVPGPSDYSLTAVLQFRPQDMKHIEAAALKIAPAKRAELSLQPWFPTALKKQAAKGSNSSQVIRGQRLDASAFYKMSFANGYLLHVDGTDTAVLMLSTM